MSGLLGIPINIIAWILLVITTAFSWLYYSQINALRDTLGDDKFIDSVYTLVFVSAIISTIALAGLTVSTAFYTAQFRDMGAISASLFFLEWIMIAIITALFWLTTDVTNKYYQYRTIGAICSSVALVLFSVYYMMEIYPYFKSMEKGAKKKKAVNIKVKKLKKKIKAML